MACVHIRPCVAAWCGIPPRGGVRGSTYLCMYFFRTAQVAEELGGEEGCNDALPLDALSQMLYARQAEVEERLRACAAGGPEAGGSAEEEAGWAAVRSSIQLLLEAELVAIDDARTMMVEREEVV